MKRISMAVGVGAVLMTTTLPAPATPVTFFGRDLAGTNAIASSHPLADAARTAFLSHLSGSGTETFEEFASGALPPYTLRFGTVGTASLTSINNPNGGPGGGSIATATASGRFAISGTHYYDAYATTVLTFTRPTDAFGFYATDEGDGGNDPFSLLLTDVKGVVTTLTIANTTKGSAANSGSALYFGFYDLADTYTKISIFGPNTSSASDAVGLDDFSIGTARVPEPMTVGLVAIGLVAAGAARRRRR